MEAATGGLDGPVVNHAPAFRPGLRSSRSALPEDTEVENTEATDYFDQADRRRVEEQSIDPAQRY